jgi:thioredoxin reductase
MSAAYDVVIVGGGAAGLSAALVLGRCRRSVLLVDEGKPRNASSHGVHCLLGHEGLPPRDLLARGRSELERYKTVTVRTGCTITIVPKGDRFSVACADGFTATARKILLATGMKDDVPDRHCAYGRMHHAPIATVRAWRQAHRGLWGRG